MVNGNVCTPEEAGKAMKAICPSDTPREVSDEDAWACIFVVGISENGTSSCQDAKHMG